jgi:hypothetical protein
MKKIFFAFLAISLFNFTFLSEKKSTKTGSITFEASVPSFEEVKGKNEAVTCVMNTSTGEIAALALVKGFRFKVALMEEHFNENYMESSKFPKATFKGKVEDFDSSKLTSSYKDYTLKGKIELHGKSKDVTTTAKIKQQGENIEIKTSFQLNPADFDIKIPSVVSKKIAKKVDVDAHFSVK